MTNEDLARFYKINPNASKRFGFVRYDKDGKIPGLNTNGITKFEVKDITNVIYADEIATIDGMALVDDNNTQIPFTIDIPIANSDRGLVIDANESNNGIDIRFASEVSLNGPDTPPSAMQGTLEDTELALLQSSDHNCIVFNNEIYKLSSRGRKEGSLIYSCIERENNQTIIKTIAITTNTKGWQLFETPIA